MTFVTLQDLKPESSYNVRVRTVNALGSSVFSLEANFDTASELCGCDCVTGIGCYGERGVVKCVCVMLYGDCVCV